VTGRASASAYPDRVTQFLVALVPSIGVLFIFWIGMRALLQADRRERAAQARIEAAERLGNRSADVAAPESGGGNAEPGPNNEGHLT
jgi:hypothetical protein